MKKLLSYLLIFVLFASLLPISTSAETVPETAIPYIPNDENMLVGTIDYEGQVNTYEITPEATGDMVIYQANNLYTWAVLYDETMKQMDVIRDPSVFHVEKGHHYYLKIKMVINIPETTGEYKFKIILPNDAPVWDSKYEPNDTLQLAYPLQSAQMITSTIEHKSDRDFYKIDVTKPGQIFATITNKDTFINVLDETGKNLNWIISKEAYGQSFGKWVTPGIYYISIGPINGIKGPYDFQVTYPSNQEVTHDTFGEPNNVLQEAVLLEPDETYQFKFENDSDRDWYKFVLTEPKRIAIEGVQEQLGIGTIWGYNEKGESVSGFSQYTDIQPNYIHQLTEVLPAGTYYFFVYRTNNTIKIGNYSLKLTSVSADDITNTNTMILPFDQPFAAKIDYSWDVDPFVYWDTQFDGSLQLRVRSTFSPALEVFYDYGTKTVPVITRDGEDIVYTFNVKKSTTYYININSPSGIYGDAATYTLTATRKAGTAPGTASAPVLTGVDGKSIPIGTVFDPLEGVKATDAVDGNITSSIRISGTVNTKAVGTYLLTYAVKNSQGKEVTVTRKVIVYDDVRPVFEGVKDVAIPVGTDFDPLAGVKAIDNADGDITGAIEIFGRVYTKTKGTYWLTYEVRDTSGNKATLERKITVYDNETPWFEGITDKSVPIGTAFDPLAGVKATDMVDGDVTSAIQVIGTVNVNAKGTYDITYKVSDSSGNEAYAPCTITVFDNVKPDLKGVSDKAIPINTAFNPRAGVGASDNIDGDLTSYIQISGSVNVKAKGTYGLTYKVKDRSGNETTATRKITVYDNVKPVLTGVTNKTININTTFYPPTGVSATDNVDGNLTKTIQIKGAINTKVKGVYVLTYSVRDKSGNTSTMVRKITVKDNIKPVIYGAKSKTIKRNSTLNPRAGVTAKDNSDGNLTNKIKISGSVNTRKKGKYTLTYYVYDQSGNKTTVKRKITVK